MANYGRNSCTYCGKWLGNDLLLSWPTCTCSMGCHIRIMDSEDPLDDSIREKNYNKSMEEFTKYVEERCSMSKEEGRAERKRLNELSETRKKTLADKLREAGLTTSSKQLAERYKNLKKLES